MPHPSHSSRLNHPDNIGGGEQNLKLIIKFSPCPIIFYPRPKYPPQHPILKHLQSVFLPLSERPCFTPIQNNRQNYCFAYINLQVLRNQTGRQNIMMKKTVFWILSIIQY
ncbi:hypothetical protein L798_06503 [Zootermopsis nevadensis]|uniref:Uncharacterized protein n=1 Tax=Zootermopsis nevadensis TaxID=136037 RepID=A0A067RKN4_ZOONE|nr:hypothetical protein L798_06503 [Zootermopsis nevadensis]